MWDDDGVDGREVMIAGERLTLPEALKRSLAPDPPLAQCRAAAALRVSPTAYEIERSARWLQARDALQAAGVEPATWLALLLRAALRTCPEAGFPPAEVLAEALFAMDRELVQRVAEAAVALEPGSAGNAPEIVVLALARHGEPDARFDRLLSLNVDWPFAREILRALPPARRAGPFSELLGEPFNRMNAIWRLRRLLMFTDLMDDPTRALMERRIRAITSVPDPMGVDDPTEELLARLHAGFEVPPDQRREADGLTAAARLPGADRAARALGGAGAARGAPLPPDERDGARVGDAGRGRVATHLARGRRAGRGVDGGGHGGAREPRQRVRPAGGRSRSRGAVRRLPPDLRGGADGRVAAHGARSARRARWGGDGLSLAGVR